jgi:flagellar assembly protein FliH
MPSLISTVHFPSPVRRVALNAEEIAKAARVEAGEAARQLAYRQGFADASEFQTQQLAEQREEVISLVERTFESLRQETEKMWKDFGSLLPQVAIEVARRIISGMEPESERVRQTVDEVLAELAPGTRDIEIRLAPGDLAVLSRYDEKCQDRFPGLRFVADETLVVGDCLLHSPFGRLDATIGTKFQTLAASLK